MVMRLSNESCNWQTDTQTCGRQGGHSGEHYPIDKLIPNSELKPYVASKFEVGAESMRLEAMYIVHSWHKAKWNDQESLSIAEVHQLLTAIAGDIQIAVVFGESPAPNGGCADDRT